jgi:CheY-like chemotaxis protein
LEGLVLEAAPPGLGRRILVCDDHELVRATVSAVLSQQGYRVLEAETTAGALGQIARERPDLVIMDLHVGGRSGIDAIQELRRMPELASTPVMLVSGELEGRSGWMEQAGADAFMAKPFELPAFLGAVADLLER